MMEVGEQDPIHVIASPIGSISEETVRNYTKNQRKE
jgi:hypothetical protein